MVFYLFIYPVTHLCNKRKKQGKFQRDTTPSSQKSQTKQRFSNPDPNLICYLHSTWSLSCHQVNTPVYAPVSLGIYTQKHDRKLTTIINGWPVSQ